MSFRWGLYRDVGADASARLLAVGKRIGLQVILYSYIVIIVILISLIIFIVII